MRLAAVSRGDLEAGNTGKMLQEKTPTSDFEAGIELFLRLARELSEGEEIEGIFGGIAGPLDSLHGKLVNSPNISGWIGKPLKHELERACKAPVFLENDAALVGLGEAIVGAGRGYKIVAYITVSTGVGGARIVGGEIDKSAFGFEPGHQIIFFNEKESRPCDFCGVSGDLESLIGGYSMQERYSKKPHEINDEDIWNEYARLLSVGLNNIAVLWSPEAIVLGGSMIVKKPGISVEKTRNHFEKTLCIFPEKPEIKKAELEDEGGLHGALAFLRQNIT